MVLLKISRQGRAFFVTTDGIEWQISFLKVQWRSKKGTFCQKVTKKKKKKKEFGFEKKIIIKTKWMCHPRFILLPAFMIKMVQPSSDNDIKFEKSAIWDVCAKGKFGYRTIWFSHSRFTFFFKITEYGFLYSILSTPHATSRVIALSPIF